MATKNNTQYSYMTDIIFVAVPYVLTTEPIMAPAVLKAIAEKQGFTAVALDLNIEIVNQLKHNDQSQDIVDFFLYKCPKPDLALEISNIIDQSAHRILDYKPKIIGLSLLTSQSKIFTQWLCIKLKTLSPDTKIIIGGSGIRSFVADNDNTFCKELMQLGLIDHYITGDGEVSLVEFLKGNLTYPGIDNDQWIQLTDISNFPFPDYTDYNFKQYEDSVIPLVDNKGCVRTCEFCDVIEHWKKFVFRSAESTFQEMLHQIKTHNIRHFSMRNSLTNGNTKEFKKWLDLICDYNQTQPPALQISWRGYFIVREQHQHPEDMWDKLAKSNADLLLGVESVLQHIRYSMGKKFTNEALDYHLAMGQKYQVPLTLLMIVAYPTETLADFEFTKSWLKDRLSYAKNSVHSVILNFASVLPGTGLEKKKEEYNVVTGQHPSVWFNTNLAITAQQRQQYWNDLHDICKSFNTDYSDILQWQQKSAINTALEYSQEVEN